MFKMFVLVILVYFAFLAGCGDSDNPADNNDQITVGEAYTGSLEIEKLDLGYPVTRTDSVTLTINGIRYELIHHSISTRLCNTGGEIVINSEAGFVNLMLDTTHTNNCDMLRVPMGVFHAEITDSTLEMDTVRVVSDSSGSVIDTVQYDFDLRVVP